MRTLTKAGVAILWFLLNSQNAFSQTISIPDTLQGWDQIWVGSLNGSQATYNNWPQGGASSVSGTASSMFTVMKREGRKGYGFRVNLKYGQSYVRDEGFKKTDDVLSIRSRLTNDFEDGGKVAAFASAWFQTQFDKGYDYGAKFAGGDSLISNFLSPVYMTENMGVAYTPEDYLTIEVGIGLKQTVVKDDSLTVNYGLEPGENFRSEGGITTGFNFHKEIATNILYSGSLETFTNLLIPFSKTDVVWTNELVGQINKIISASLQFELKYDDDFSRQVQLKQVLSAGVSVNLY